MSRTENQSIVDEIAYVTSNDIVNTIESLRRCARIASYLGNSSEYANSLLDNVDSSYENVYVDTPLGPMKVGESHEYLTTETIIGGIASCRVNINGIIDTISSFATRAASLGFTPPSNPFDEITKLRAESSSSLYIVGATSQLADDIIYNISVYLQLIDAEYNGQLNLDGNVITGAAQLAHVGFSTNGFIDFSPSDSDLMTFLIDSDSIKRTLASNVLSTFDFTKRIPKILFTMKYDPDGIDRGAIVAWRRMPDASGYIIKRHDVFANKDKQFMLSTSQALESFEIVRDYVREWGLSFYDGLSDNFVYAYLDKTVEKDKYYVYTMEAYQNIKNPEESVFDVEVSIGSTSYVRLNEIKERINNVVSLRLSGVEGIDTDSISPYPFLSKIFYDDSKYDWIIAGVNVLMSARRSDDRSTVRRFSYIGSKYSFVREQIENTTFMLPKEIDSVIENVRKSITNYGVSATILEILDKTGMLFFFDSKEESLYNDFQRAGDIKIDSSSKMLEVLSAIDPETATISVSALLSNLRGNAGSTSYESTAPTEIEISPKTNDEIADDFLQYVGSVLDGEDIIDLTTVDGIGRFMRVLRDFYDFSLSKGINFSSSIFNGEASLQEVAQ